MLDDRDLDIEYKPNLLEAIAKALDDYPGASIDLKINLDLCMENFS